MIRFGIVPIILDKEPPATVKIVYGCQGDVDYGTEYKPGTLIDPPTEVSWPVDKHGSLYTLLMVDPDSKPVETIHWLVVNIPGNKKEEGHLVTTYSGPKPPLGTGRHRYIVTVYKQLDRLPELPRMDTQELRHSTTMRQIVSKYNLGAPIAGNFLTAQPDDYSINFWKNKLH